MNYNHHCEDLFCETCRENRKLRDVIWSLIDGRFDEYDYNGEASGYFYPSGWSLSKGREGDEVELGAKPNSIRECSDGEIKVSILATKDGFGYRDIQIQIHDKLGTVGGYPNFEWCQYWDISGTYVIRLLSDSSDFAVNPTESFELEKVRRRVRDALNKTTKAEEILSSAGIFSVKVF